MKIHLRQIPAEGLRVEGEEECPIPELAAEGIVCAGPLRYALDVGLSEGALWENGSLAQPVEVECVACLEKFVHVIEVRDFALHTELGGPETVDLTPFMREDILLNLPSYPRCDREGGRICPAADTIKPATEPTEGLAVPPPDWSALDKLKFEKN
jgi:uncharacterized metal-binding protein YceD (DUF177 family)